MFRTLMISGMALLLLACQKSATGSVNTSAFDSVPTIKPLSPQLNEISGIADSKINPGYLWAQEDSGNPPEIHLIRHDGTVVKSVYIKGVANRDWEDICLSNGSLYLGDIGDNSLSYTSYTFYKFPEPLSSTDTVRNVETISFTYPDGAHDAEAFVVDSASGDIYIITKRDNPSRVYRLSYPFGATNQANFVTTLPYTMIVSATLSPNSKEMIIKTYTNLYRSTRTSSGPVSQFFTSSYSVIPYKLEPQGEAVGFDYSNSGYYTISEKGFSNQVNIYFYKRR